MAPVPIADDEKTFEQLQARIARTIELLGTVDAAKLDGKSDKEILMETRSMGSFKFSTGQVYVSECAIPNFHFHFSTAYCILRVQGVPLAAFDYLGKDTFVRA